MYLNIFNLTDVKRNSNNNIYFKITMVYKPFYFENNNSIFTISNFEIFQT